MYVLKKVPDFLDGFAEKLGLEFPSWVKKKHFYSIHVKPVWKVMHAEIFGANIIKFRAILKLENMVNVSLKTSTIIVFTIEF